MHVSVTLSEKVSLECLADEDLGDFVKVMQGTGVDIGFGISDLNFLILTVYSTDGKLKTQNSQRRDLKYSRE